MLVIRREFVDVHEKQKAENLPENDVPNIFRAAGWGDVEELNEAIKHWDINALDENGMTALHHAAGNLRHDNVDRLLEEIDNGLDPQIEDKFGRDPAWLALEANMRNAESKKMYDKLSPFVYPIADEDKELYADDAPEM